MSLLQISLSSDQLEHLADLIASRLGSIAPKATPKHLSCEDAAEALGMSLSTLRRSIRDGMPVMRPTPRKIVIDLELAAQWMADRAKIGGQNA